MDPICLMTHCLATCPACNCGPVRVRFGPRTSGPCFSVLTTVILLGDTGASRRSGQLSSITKRLPWALPSRPIVDLIGAMETQSEPSELELDDVVITNPHIEAILENEDWVEDAS